jgi:hypothetical protein
LIYIKHYQKNSVPGYFMGSAVADRANGKHTIAAAQGHCAPDPECSSFTFIGSCTAEGPLDIFFKGNHNDGRAALVPDAAWCTFHKNTTMVEAIRNEPKPHLWKEAAVQAVSKALKKGGKPEELFGRKFAAKFGEKPMIAMVEQVIPASITDILVGEYTPAEALGLCTSDPVSRPFVLYCCCSHHPCGCMYSGTQ